MSTHPAGADPGTPANASAGELHHGVLGLPDALAQSVALLSLAIGVAFAASGAAADAGAAAPLTYVVAAVGALCLGSVIIRFTRRIASVGGVYTYMPGTDGRRLGIVVSSSRAVRHGAEVTREQLEAAVMELCR